MAFIELDSKPKEWTDNKSGNFVIIDEVIYNDSKDNPVSCYTHILDAIRSELQKKISNITREVRELNGKYNKRIDAKEVNKVIREKLKTIPDICFEVTCENNVYLPQKNQGFDFVIFNLENNLCRLSRNCQEDNNLHWDSEIGKRENWKLKANELQLPNAYFDGSIEIDDTEHIIIGEIQCGNHAMGERDILRLIKHCESNRNMNNELIVYITVVGNLHKYISDGVVYFNKMKKEFDLLSKKIDRPIILMGIDIED